MKKKQLEIVVTMGSVIIFIILVIAAGLIMRGFSNYGYTAALLIFVIIMGIAGLKLAEIPDK
ncbi:MAG: hypothetical protein OIN88_09395 [Candidatus Methanoperedens sp.]|nr:hypothetical protein [Candidatus Methanoperedens sp.]MCZ7359939.1 hypothetical protein [Candidatus Methanoperedens sp.]HLB70130.1 hypothetical protein [Candidatus Methanoperedens sp.]